MPAAMVRLGWTGWDAISARSACGRARRATWWRCRACCWSGMTGRYRDDRAALEALPGVGRKTANVVLNVAFGEPTMAVDTHIFRLGQSHRDRTGQDAARGRGRASPPRAAADAARRASLADPARALCVQGAAPRVLALRRGGMVPLSRQGGRARLKSGARKLTSPSIRTPAVRRKSLQPDLCHIRKLSINLASASD
jgi:hypothetical protein